MKDETIKAIEKAAQCIGLDVEVRNYSGRGMYGSKTQAIVGCETDIFACVALAGNRMNDDQIDEFCDDLQQLRIDSMGRGSVYY